MKRIIGACALLLGAATAAGAQSAPASQRTEVIAPPLSRALFEDPPILSRTLEWASERFGLESGGGSKRPGFFPTSGKTVPGAGWIAGGGGYRTYVLGSRAYVEASAGASMRLYKTGQAKFEWPRVNDRGLTLGSQVLWRDLTQVSYFGTGPETLDTMRSEYRVRYLDAIGYVSAQASEIVSVIATVGVLRGLHLDSATGPFRRDLPDARVLFPDEPAFRSDAIPRFRHAGIDVVADARDHPGYPSRGGLYRAAWTSFWGPADGILGFHRLETEGVQFVPLAGDWWSLAVQGWGVFTDTSEGRYIPFYMMPTLGGHALRGYHAYRFSDKNLLLTSIESRVRLTPHLDGALFYDAGSVAAAARDLDLDRRNWGVGIRLHTRTSTLARLDIARGDEGWRILFNMSDPFRMSRVTRRAPQLPYSP
jgi:outer membrane protein assembly factor BamA